MDFSSARLRDPVRPSQGQVCSGTTGFLSRAMSGGVGGDLVTTRVLQGGAKASGLFWGLTNTKPEEFDPGGL